MHLSFPKYLARFFGPAPTGSIGPVVYKIGAYTLELPQDHLLPLLQRTNPLYDRFLETLGQLPIDGWMVDIGANVGDSAAALLGTAKKKIICVEPEPGFFSYLKRNATLFEKSGCGVICLNSGIGTDGDRAGLAIQGSTAHLVPTGSALSLKSLDNIVEPYRTSSQQIELIKCDIDGFDAVALASGLETISADQPLIYFEAEIKSKAALMEMAGLCKKLHDIGYIKFSLFDNFGLLFQHDANLEALADTFAYTLNLNQGKSSRSIYYFDILASSPRRQHLHDQALSSYSSKWMR